MTGNEDDHGRKRRTPALGNYERNCVDVDEILQGKREAIIVHNGVAYRLRLTANGKLILTK